MDDDLTLTQSDAISIHTGFPNPALDTLTSSRSLALDLNKLLIHHPSSTYLFQIRGHEWEAAGIFDGDVALIDRSIIPKNHYRVVFWQASGFAISRHDHLRRGDRLWGVITAIIHQFEH